MLGIGIAWAAMDTKISALSSDASVTGSEELAINDGGTTKKTTAQTIANLFSGGGAGTLVQGDGTSVDNAIPRYVSTTEGTLEDTGYYISDTNQLIFGQNELYKPTLRGYDERFIGATSSGGTLVLDYDKSNVFTVHPYENVDTFSIINWPGGDRIGSLTMHLFQASTTYYTFSWGDVLWNEATSPFISTTAAQYVITFQGFYEGENVKGFYGGGHFSAG